MNEPDVVIAVRDIVNTFGTQVVHDGVSFVGFELSGSPAPA